MSHKPFVSRSLLKPASQLTDQEHKQAVRSLYEKFRKHDLLDKLPAQEELIDEIVVTQLRDQALFDLESMHPTRSSKAKKKVIDHTLYHLLLVEKPSW